MSATKVWGIGALILVAVVSTLGWLLGIAPQLENARLARASIVETQAVNAAQESALAEIKQQYEGIDALRRKLADLQEAVPGEAHLSELFTQLNSLALSRGVNFTNFTAAEAQAYAPTASAVAAPIADPPAAGNDEAVETPVPSVASPAGTSTPPVPPTPVVSPLVTATNFVAITITMEVSGGESNVMGFLEGVQSTDRLILVSDFSTTRAGTGEFTARMTGIIYVLLDPSSVETAGVDPSSVPPADVEAAGS